MRMITVDSITKNCSEWARKIGISRQAFMSRLNYNKNNLDVNRLIKSSSDYKSNKRKKYVSKYTKKFGITLSDIAKRDNISIPTAHKKLFRYLDKKINVVPNSNTYLCKKIEINNTAVQITSDMINNTYNMDEYIFNIIHNSSQSGITINIYDKSILGNINGWLVFNSDNVNYYDNDIFELTYKKVSIL